MANVTYQISQIAPKWQYGTMATTLGERGDQVLQSVLSTAYIQVAVSAYVAGTPVNPTADVVSFAFTVVGTNPVSGDWKTGSWTTAPSGAYLAQVLIGPAGANTLTRGTYAAWVRITDSPEVPIQPIGILQIV